MTVLLIDNYDSFTYNLAHLFGELGAEVVVRRNDEITVAEIEVLKPDAVVISPGPCTPKEAGISNEVIAKIGPKLPVLGVCLGHQCIGFVSGAEVVRAERLMHGKTDQIHHDGKTIYAGMPNPFTATRAETSGSPTARGSGKRFSKKSPSAGSTVSTARSIPGAIAAILASTRSPPCPACT